LTGVKRSRQIDYGAVVIVFQSVNLLIRRLINSPVNKLPGLLFAKFTELWNCPIPTSPCLCAMLVVLALAAGFRAQLLVRA
jgi:hypothetical protein